MRFICSEMTFSSEQVDRQSHLHRQPNDAGQKSSGVPCVPVRFEQDGAAGRRFGLGIEKEQVMQVTKEFVP